jgi:putative holliday junction resolvase
MRVVGIDLGTRRVGVAVSDDRAMVATPHAVLQRTGDAAADRAALVAVVRELGAERVVVGLPLSLDGTVGPAARWAGEEADALASLLDVPLELHDERLSTVSALRRPPWTERNGGPGTGTRRPGRPLRSGQAGRDRRPVDDRAAAVMLQSWLDGHRPEPRG